MERLRSTSVVAPKRIAGFSDKNRSAMHINSHLKVDLDLGQSSQITAPSWCTRHRTRHNTTPPHQLIVFVVYVILLSFCSLFFPIFFVPCFTPTVSSTPIGRNPDHSDHGTSKEWIHQLLSHSLSTFYPIETKVYAWMQNKGAVNVDWLLHDLCSCELDHFQGQVKLFYNQPAFYRRSTQIYDT